MRFDSIEFPLFLNDTIKIIIKDTKSSDNESIGDKKNWNHIVGLIKKN